MQLSNDHPLPEPSIPDVHILHNRDHIDPHGCRLSQKIIVYGCSQSIKHPPSRSTGNSTLVNEYHPSHVLQTIRSLPHCHPGHHRRRQRESPTSMESSALSLTFSQIDLTRRLPHHQRRLSEHGSFLRPRRPPLRIKHTRKSGAFSTGKHPQNYCSSTDIQRYY